MTAEIDDSLQQRIVELNNTSALVLAGPGCGKTHILARRIFHANAFHGIGFNEMLCVTFTNRAAREMKSRITNYLGYRPGGLFVGNIHRYCLRFLFENELIAPDTGILDEEDRDEFLATLGLVTASDVRDFTNKAMYIYQTAHDHPNDIVRRLDRLPGDEDFARYDTYCAYKEENRLLDFDDILMRTYTALCDENARDDYKMASYTWVQVDEVQDMTPLQLAIVELASRSERATRLFLGDEQQSIFNFTGAGGRALDAIKRMCDGNIMHLSRNYRSPRYLVDLCNNMASSWLDIDPSLLPTPVYESYLERPLLSFCASKGNLRFVAANIARQWLAGNRDENVMILTRTNGEAEDMSFILEKAGIDHFLIPRQDVFHRVGFKTLWSHLAVIDNRHNNNAWSRLLYQTGATKTLSGAQRLTSQLRKAGIAVDDLFRGTEEWTLPRFKRLFENETIAIIDTETTGLDVFGDDVVQIAAVKVCKGEIVAGSELEIFIESDKPLPTELSDGSPNPLCDIYAEACRLSPQEGFAILAEYLSGDIATVAGHNTAFDTAIISNNIRRRTTLEVPEQLKADRLTIDSLDIARLLYPRLRSYKLTSLITKLNIEGCNSHNAVEDAAATFNLLKHLYIKAEEKLPLIASAADNETVLRTARRLGKYYGEFFRSARQRLDVNGGSICEELTAAHRFFTESGAIEPVKHFDYILKLVDTGIVDSTLYPTLRDQLLRYLFDLLTYHESDLFANGIVKERLSVMTVHKAKGLECENVIVLDVQRRFDSIDDHSRLLYVAFSRARKRLAIGTANYDDPVMQSVALHFSPMSRREISVAVNSESVNMCSRDDY